MSKVALIIPCFNEQQRLNTDAFASFIAKAPTFDLFFVNDGSFDKTGFLLDELSGKHKDRIFVIHKIKNEGKASAIRDAVLQIHNLHNRYDYTGYTDADLSTSLDQCKILADEIAEKKADCVFGSRIKKFGSQIERSLFRHLCGRLITTIIDTRFRLGIYDTQCGAKFFSSELLASVCKEPFKSKWLFDVEIFLRLFRQKKEGIFETPLQSWKDSGNSKLNWLDFPQIVKELYLLFKYYKR